MNNQNENDPARYSEKEATHRIKTITDSTGSETKQTNIGSEQTRRTPAPVPTDQTVNIPPKDIRPQIKDQKKGDIKWLRMGCIGLAAVIFLMLIVGSYGIYRYYSIVTTLPSIDDLRSKASQFETTKILDRHGDLLYEIIDPNAGRRTYLTLDKIPANVIAATIATEDKDYYNHPGFDPIAITRALWQNYTASETVSGASTITQQVARLLLFSPAERSQRTTQRKTREIVLAAEITRRYSKEEILEIYLNEVYYGNQAYGIEAAAETYFKTAADALTLGQAAFLAGLPQAPAIYDVFANKDETLYRDKQVLVLLYQLSQEKGCIYVSNAAERVCVDASMALEAAKEIEEYPFESNPVIMKHPHWVNFIRSELEKTYEPQTIYRSGFTVQTTMEPELQEKAEEIVNTQVQALAGKNVKGGALVAIQPGTGEILAMVGSPDFYNEENSGQVNMAVSPRQPGSSIKPLTYTAAFEKGWTPGTLIWDVYSEFPPSGKADDPAPPYIPVNYDGFFHGSVTVRTALANSYNIPAVKTLNYIGIYEDPDKPGEGGFINFARRVGITTLNREDFGLALTLGGGEVSLLDLTSAFGIFANNGLRVPPVAITKITDYTGNVIFERQPTSGDQVIRPEHAYLITSILSDNEARTPSFGANSPLNLPFAAAAKTGTTNDFRDNWTLGYTPDLVIGVWVGNPDYTPMINSTGLTGAAPIWAEAMKFAIGKLTANQPTPFSRPSTIIDKVICATTGAEPSDWCPSQRSEVFAVDQPPLPKDQDMKVRAPIDGWTELRASPACMNFLEDVDLINITDPWARKWLTENSQGNAWLEQIGISGPVRFVPHRECREEDPKPTLEFAGMNENQVVYDNPVDIYVIANASDKFKNFQLEYGLGEDPKEWKTLTNRISDQYINPEKIASWDAEEIPSGRITLRLVMYSTEDTSVERRLHLDIQVPTRIPSPSPSATATETSTITPLPIITLPPPETTPPVAPTEFTPPVITPPDTTIAPPPFDPTLETGTP